MSVSDAFKKCMQDLHKKNLEKNYQHKTIENRLTNFQDIRKHTRETLMLQKRNIDLNNMSPIISPLVTRNRIAVVKPRTDVALPFKSNARLEMLQKWKEEKEKMKKEAKKKTKPIFKVCHVSNDVGISSLENANTKIKGKSIKSSWAPVNHKFHAPKNIKPMNGFAPSKPMTGASKGAEMAGKPSSSMNNKKNTEPQINLSKRVTRAQSCKSQESQTAPAIRLKKCTTSKTGNTNSKIVKPTKTNDRTPVKEVAKAQHNKNLESSNNASKKKTVGWNTVDSTESDDGFADDIPKSSRRKKYAKTPIRRKNTIISVSSSDGDSFKTPPKKKQQIMQTPKSDRNCVRTEDKITIYSDEEISLKTPRKSSSRKSVLRTPRSARKSSSRVEVDEETAPAYISPFVTISRGKDSARKEFKTRLSSGGTLATPDSKNKSFSSGTSPKTGAEYFARLLEQETARIEGICDQWEKYKEENELSEEAQTLIFVSIGQSRLLISKKFQQFRGLIDKCRSSEYEDHKPITCKDLHGFWDMIFMQVEDLKKRFSYLEKVKENNWEEVVPDRKQVATKRPKMSRPKKSSAPSRMRDFIRAARNNKGQLNGDPVVTVHENASPAKITPVKERFTPVRSSSTRRSLRVSLLCGKVPKRPSTSPCVAMMKISHAIKSGDGVTPSKSILKTVRSKEDGAVTKSVLFKDELDVALGSPEGGARSREDLMSFSPVTPPRRSTRLKGIKF